MDGIKKTALFLSGLEWKTVDLLLARLEPEQARAVRREMMSLESVSVQESGRLANEFLSAAGGRRRNTVIEHQLAASATYAPPKRTARFVEDDRHPKPVRPSAKPFEFFRGVEPSEIASEISSEHPQTVAVVLAHLPASLAGEVLGGLSTSLQRDVARRLSNFEEMDTQILHEIETAIRDRFENRRRDRQRRARGSAVVRHILKGIDADAGLRISFDDLDRLGDADLARLFRSVDSVTAMLSLVGAKPSLIERVTKNFTRAEEREMRRQLKQVGRVTEADVRKARAAVLEKIA